MSSDLYKDSYLTLSSQIITIIAGIVTMPIVIKSIGTSTYGIFTLIVSSVTMILGLSSLGVNVVSRRYLPSARNNKQRAGLFYPQFYFQLFVLFTIFLFFLVFQEQYKLYMMRNDFFLPNYILIIYLFLYFLYSQSLDYLRYTSRIFFMNVANIFFAYSFLFFLVIYSTYANNFGLTDLFTIKIFSYSLIVLPVIFLIFKELSVKFIFFKIYEIYKHIKLGLPIILNFLVDFIISTSDRFVLAFFMGTTTVGYYVPAYVLGSIILLIPKSFGVVVPQLMSKNIDKGNVCKSKQILFESVKFFMVLSIPFVFGIHLISKEALILLTNEEIAIHSQNVVIIVALASVFYGFSIFMSIANMVELKTLVIFKANSIAAIINIFLNVVFLYFIQSIFVPAITTLVSYLFSSIYFFIFLDKKWYDKRYFLLLLRLMIISLGMYIITENISIMLGNYSILSMLIIKVVLSITIYIVFLLIFKIYSIEQILSIRNFKKKELS